MLEDIIHKVRIRMVNKIFFSELRFIEETQSATIYTPLTQELISQATIVFVNASQSVMVLIFSSLYLFIYDLLELFYSTCHVFSLMLN